MLQRDLKNSQTNTVLKKKKKRKKLVNASSGCKWIVVEMLSILNGIVHRRSPLKKPKVERQQQQRIEWNAQKRAKGERRRQTGPKMVCNRWISLSIRSLLLTHSSLSCTLWSMLTAWEIGLYARCPIRSQEALNLQQSSCASSVVSCRVVSS